MPIPDPPGVLLVHSLLADPQDLGDLRPGPIARYSLASAAGVGLRLWQRIAEISL
jgi:hypothetical protein